MTNAERIALLERLTAELPPGFLNDLCYAAFLKDTEEERSEGNDPTELLRDWCADLAEQLESEL